MDQIDRKLLQILSQNADATATQMAETVNLSVPAVNKRIQRLRSTGVIRRFTIVTDPEEVGKPIQAFVLILLENRSKISDFAQYIQNDPDVLECYSITGEYDFVLKICAKDVRGLDEKLVFLKGYQGVVKSYTMLSLTQYKYQPSILPDVNG